MNSELHFRVYELAVSLQRLQVRLNLVQQIFELEIKLHELLIHIFLGVHIPG